MSKLTRLVATIGTGVLLALALSPATAATADDKTTLTIGVTQDLDSANPFTGLTSVAYEIFQLQYPTLTQYAAADFSIVPGVADSWEESADQKTWTFKIHPGLKWSDGVAFTAKDVAYTFNRILKGEYEKTNYGSYVENMTNVVATDDTTVVFTVSQPTPVMDHMYVFMLPEHIWSKIDAKAVKSFKNEGTPDAPTVGSGPYVMVERKVGQFIRMQANPNWRDGKRSVEEIVFKIFANDDAMGQALKKGEIDFAEGLETNVWKSLQGVEGITTVAAAPASFNELAINTGAALADGKPIGDGNPLLKDKALRQAMAHAVDKENIVAKVLAGEGTPGTTVIPPLYTQWHAEPSNPFTYDPAKAKALLDTAGYKEGSDGIRADAQGNRLSFRLFFRTNNPTSPKAAEFLKGYLKAVGIEITVKGISEDALTETIGQGNFDMFEWSWSVEPDPNYMLSTFTCENRSYVEDGTVYANLSDSFYCNPEYDKLFAQQTKETTQSKRAEIVKQMQQIIYEDVPYIVTYYANNHEAYRSDRFTGFVPQPADKGTLLYQWGSWSYQAVKSVTEETETPTASASSSAAPNASGSAAPTPSASSSANTDAASSQSSGGSALPFILGGLGAAALVGVGFALARRGGATAGTSADDRE